MRTIVNRMLRRLGYQVVRRRDVRPTQTASVGAPVPLREEDVRNCRLLANRVELLDRMPKGGVIAEVGVGFGDLSARMLATLAPREFHAIDLFGWDEVPIVWGVSTRDVFDGRSHEEFYRARFAEQIRQGTVHVRQGRSWETLSRYADASFDLIYVDAGHDYESVKRDAEVCTRKVKPDGFLIFNDYIMYDHAALEPYGVVHVVNDLCVSGGYEMLYFALHEQLFCDVALRKVR
jgi:hypothetical protein